MAELIKNNPPKNHPGNITPKEITLKNFIPENTPENIITEKYHPGKINSRKKSPHGRKKTHGM